MLEYFGTDGIRGKANEFLTVEIAYKVGRILGYKYSEQGKGRVLIGRDTRISGTMLESALAAGFCASGCDVDLVGVIPTPGVALLIVDKKYDGGIMISASHNPYYDNGLKIFNHEGVKIDYFLQKEIEDYINDKFELPHMVDDYVGIITDVSDLLETYKSYIRLILNMDLSGMKVLVDCANGSSSVTVDLIRSMGAEVDIIHASPNGKNINDHCGSTHIEVLQDKMKEKAYDFGFSLDGDADRVMIVDDKNQVVDGDLIIYLAANYFKERDLLTDNTVVFTKMSNLGLIKALDKKGIDYVITDVGDSHVHEKMEAEGYVVGGEQSGHIILKHLSVMSDGVITALLMLKIMREKNQSLSELSQDFKKYPQKLVNVKVDDAKAILENKILVEKIKMIEDELKDDGRLLIRASGTEPLLRVMVEAEDAELCNQYTKQLVGVVESLIEG